MICGSTMSDQDDGLLAIEVDADDYAETAAGDAPTVSRTYQSEEDFQIQKASYNAKLDGNNTYRDLISAVPVLDNRAGELQNGLGFTDGESKVRLSKKDFQLLGYAVAELYYDKQYEKIQYKT